VAGAGQRRVRAHYDAHAVVDDDPPAHVDGGVDLDAGDETGELGDDPTGQLVAGSSQAIGEAVQQERVQSRGGK
jgi:hypothetical protein